MNAALPLSQQVFTILAALIEEHAGLHYRLDERELLADKLTPRARERGFENLLDYYYFLRYDPAAQSELQALLDSLVINETYFFREPAALKLIVERMIPELIARGERPRVWCAACATGEEPLTLAMLLDGAGLLGRVEIVASDISQRALAHARAGLYYRRSLRSLPAGVSGRWLIEQADALRAAPELIEAIDWRRVNLCAAAETAAIGSCDVILCRNVLIYFSDETVVQVIHALSSQLRPGGALLVGVSESLLRFGTALTCEEIDQVFYYRKQP